MSKILEAERHLDHTPLSVIYRQYYQHLKFQLPLFSRLLSNIIKGPYDYKHVVLADIRQGPNGEIEGREIGEVDCNIKMSDAPVLDMMQDQNFSFRATSKSSSHPTGKNFFHEVRVQFQNGDPKLFFDMKVPRDRSLDAFIGFQPDVGSFLRFQAKPQEIMQWYVVKGNWAYFDYPIVSATADLNDQPIGLSQRIDNLFISSALKGQLPGFYSEDPNRILSFSREHFDNMSPFPPIYRRN